jgi:hypothetical protein
MHAGVSEWLVRRPLGEHARCTPRPQTGTEGDGEEIASAPGTGDYFFPPSNSHTPQGFHPTRVQLLTDLAP